MATERVVLCGGVKLTGALPLGAGAVELDLWGRNGKPNVKLEIEDIHERLRRDVPPAFHDLLEIATYVYVADQAVSRGGKDVDTFGGSWRRAFEFHVPVRAPDLWNGAEMKRVLCATLGFLSDDYYEFTFYPANDPPPFQMYLKLDGGGGGLGQPDQVMLFSAGLDSLAGAIDEAIVRKQRIVLVNHRSTEKHNSKHRELERLLAEKAGYPKPEHIAVRINKDKKLGRESTQRSRSFLYVALGATVARMVGLHNVRFYENGVVSLNLPVCAQVVGGRATRTTHPRVLRGFQSLLSLVAGETFTVDNPFMWETKGQVIQRILDAKCGPMITPSVSCAHTWEATLKFPHCGVCSQCIDRRFGIIAAKADEFDSKENYEVDIFTQSRPKNADKMMGAAYLERANEVLNIKDVGQLLTVFPQVADVLRYLDGNKASAAARLLELQRRHGVEVRGAMQEVLKRHVGELLTRSLPGDCLVKTVCESGSVTSLPAAPENGEEVSPRTNSPNASSLGIAPGRHTLTVIFTDIKDFSTLVDQDEPATLKMLEQHNAVMDACILSHEGNLVKTIGDSYMVYFHSALDGLRCAFSMQEEVAKLNRHEAIQIQVRIGINTGDVNAVRGGDLQGATVNVAKRLEEAAQPGGICISGSVLQSIAPSERKQFLFQDAGKLSLKGSSEPIHCWHVITNDLPSRSELT